MPAGASRSPKTPPPGRRRRAVGAGAAGLGLVDARRAVVALGARRVLRGAVHAVPGGTFQKEERAAGRRRTAPARLAEAAGRDGAAAVVRVVEALRAGHLVRPRRARRAPVARRAFVVGKVRRRGDRVVALGRDDAVLAGVHARVAVEGPRGAGLGLRRRRRAVVARRARVAVEVRRARHALGAVRAYGTEEDGGYIRLPEETYR